MLYRRGGWFRSIRIGGLVMLVMASEGFGLAEVAKQFSESGVWRELARQSNHVRWQGVYSMGRDHAGVFVHCRRGVAVVAGESAAGFQGCALGYHKLPSQGKALRKRQTLWWKFVRRAGML
jgi:hypothetical protein